MSVPSKLRTDITYLRRRVKPSQAPTAATTAVETTAAATAAAPVTGAAPSLTLSRPQTQAAPQTGTGSGGLSLSSSRSPEIPSRPSSPPNTAPREAPGTASSAGLNLGTRPAAAPLSGRAKKLAQQREKAKQEDHEVSLLFPAPGIADVYELNLNERLLRLTPLQSAVGTLVVSGSTAIAWETVRRVVGGQTVDGHKAGTSVTTAGNRPLVGYHGKDALVSLRHVRELRRAIFINRSSSAMGVQLFSGQSVALPPAADGTQIVLLAHRIGNVLELRAEPVPHNWPDLQIWQEFDFSMTHSAPASAYGR